MSACDQAAAARQRHARPSQPRPALLRLQAQAGDANALATSAAQLASGETDRAAETFGALLERFADTQEAYDAVATVYEQVGYAPATVGVLEAWRRIAPRGTAVVSRLGDALASAAEPVKAEAILDTLRAMGGDDAWAIRRSARAHAPLSRWPDDSRLYTEAFRASGGPVDARAGVRAARLGGLDPASLAHLWRARAPSPDADAALALSAPEARSAPSPTAGSPASARPPATSRCGRPPSKRSTKREGERKPAHLRRSSLWRQRRGRDRTTSPSQPISGAQPRPEPLAR